MKTKEEELQKEIEKEYNRIGIIGIVEPKLFKKFCNEIKQQGKAEQKIENKRLVNEYFKLKNPTSFELFKLFSNLTGLDIKEFNLKLNQQLQESK